MHVKHIATLPAKFVAPAAAAVAFLVVCMCCVCVLPSSQRLGGLVSVSYAIIKWQVEWSVNRNVATFPFYNFPHFSHYPYFSLLPANTCVTSMSFPSTVIIHMCVCMLCKRRTHEKSKLPRENVKIRKKNFQIAITIRHATSLPC